MAAYGECRTAKDFAAACEVKPPTEAEKRDAELAAKVAEEVNKRLATELFGAMVFYYVVTHWIHC